MLEGCITDGEKLKAAGDPDGRMAMRTRFVRWINVIERQEIDLQNAFMAAPIYDEKGQPQENNLMKKIRADYKHNADMKAAEKDGISPALTAVANHYVTSFKQVVPNQDMFAEGGSMREMVRAQWLRFLTQYDLAPLTAPEKKDSKPKGGAAKKEMAPKKPAKKAPKKSGKKK